LKEIDRETHIFISAKKGDGVDLLKAHLLKMAGWQTTSEGVFMARTRHLEAIAEVESYLNAALQSIHQAELVAENLRSAQTALNSITGEFTPDDLLGEIFSKFCIGK
jgi:tRNA modification GTPase